MKQLAALVLPKDVFTVKQAIKDAGLYDEIRGTEHTDDFRRAIFLNNTVTNDSNITGILDRLNLQTCEIEIVALPSKNTSVHSLKHDLQTRIKDFLELHDINNDLVIKSVPKRYVIYYPMALFSEGSWHALLKALSKEQQTLLYQSVCSSLRVSHLAFSGLIERGNEMRRPAGLVPLYGDFGPPEVVPNPTQSSIDDAFWVENIQNGIKQTWPPRHVMFSRGNFTEKARILNMPDVKNSIVADLYAGIGYFAFSYVKAGAKVVLCWEINPWSVEAISRGAKMNGWTCRVVAHEEDGISAFKEQIIVFHESNEFAESRLRSVSNIRHINLGLLPTSAPGLSIASRLHLASPSVIHMHENVAANDRFLHGEAIKENLRHNLPNARININSCTTVKTFAPGILHCVYDIKLDL